MSSNTEPTPSGTSSAPPKKPSGGRMPLPSLNQLAAKLKPDGAGAQANSTTSAPRPRLAASILRTGSSASVATNASTADSLAVNVSSTRAVSPAASASTDTPPKSNTPVPTTENGVEPLTTEKLEKHNQEIAGDNSSSAAAGGATMPPAELPRKKAVGYKNIPSLDTIARMVKARASSLSIDGTEKPPEPPMIEDPKTPGVAMKAPEHPLQFSWTIYHDQKAKFPYTPATASAVGAFNQPPPGLSSATTENSPFSALHPPEQAEYEAGLTIIGEFSTVEEFCRYFNWLKPPSKLEKNSNYHIFKSGIKPMWEDPSNAEGGKWVLTMKNNPTLLDRSWSWLAMALVGEELEDGDEICGAVVSLRTKVDRIQVWTRSKEDVEKLNGIAKKLVKLLDVSEADHIGLEFQYNSEDRPPPNKFLSIQAVPVSSFRSSFQAPPPSAGPAAAAAAAVPARQVGDNLPGNAFSGFGTGAGIGASQTWNSNRR